MNNIKKRITFSFVVLVILFSTVLVKSFYVQVINRAKLISYSDSQVVREKKVYPKRGHILDRHGNPLAVNVKRYNLFTFAKNYSEIESELKGLKESGILKRDLVRVLNNVKKRKNKFTWIARNISLKKSQIKTIKSLKSIHSEVHFGRMYPNHELASQLIGFVGIDNDGLSGIENYFDKNLKGEAKVIKYFKDAKGRAVKFDDEVVASKSTDIKLSIDKDIQGALEGFLEDGVLKHEAIRGGAGVMDADTGEILAVANYPTYDPNNIKGSKKKDRRLSFVTDPFEPGSVLKSLTVASALERKIVKEDTSYFCERGKYRVQNHYIKESDTRTAHEWLKVSDILKYSSNIGTTKIAFDLGYKSLREDFKKFGLGKRTGVEIKGESKGIFEDKKTVGALRLSNMSFGQGIGTTGIQMLATYAPFANGGYYVSPTFLKVKNDKKVKAKRIISKATSKKIEKILIDAVENGTGGNAKVKFFSVAGKTSTAQRIDSTGKYNGYVSGFIGYPVSTKKKFVVFVYIDNPKKGYYGNSVAAPIFKKITQTILYKNKDFNKLARYNKSESKAIDKLRYSQSAIRKVKKGLMPNIVGLDKTSAFRILDKARINYKSRGFGVVKEQLPLPGEKIDKSIEARVIFQAPDYE